MILDLGRVVVDFDFKRGYLELEGLCPYPAAEIPKRLGSTDLVKRFETGLVGPEEFVSGLCQILQLRVGYERFCDIWSAIFREALLPEEMLEGLASPYPAFEYEFHSFRHDPPELPADPALPRAGIVLRSRGDEAEFGDLPGCGGSRRLPAGGMLLHG